MDTNKYNEAFNTAKFLDSVGESDLALRLTESFLEKFYIEKEDAHELDSNTKERMSKIEGLLTQKHLALRSKVERNRQPYLNVAIKALIVCTVVCVTLVVAALISFSHIKTVISHQEQEMFESLKGAVRGEVTEMKTQIRSEILEIIDKAKEEIPEIIDKLKGKIIIINESDNDELLPTGHR